MKLLARVQAKWPSLLASPHLIHWSDPVDLFLLLVQLKLKDGKSPFPAVSLLEVEVLCSFKLIKFRTEAFIEYMLSVTLLLLKEQS